VVASDGQFRAGAQRMCPQDAGQRDNLDLGLKSIGININIEDNMHKINGIDSLLFNSSQSTLRVVASDGQFRAGAQRMCPQDAGQRDNLASGLGVIMPRRSRFEIYRNKY
jgi:hypothetical protein